MNQRLHKSRKEVADKHTGIKNQDDEPMLEMPECRSQRTWSFILWSGNHYLITSWSLLLYLTVAWGKKWREFCLFSLKPLSHDFFTSRKKLDFVPTEGPMSEIRAWIESLQGKVKEVQLCSLTTLLKKDQRRGTRGLVYCQGMRNCSLDKLTPGKK